MTYKIKVIGLEMKDSMILEIEADTVLQAMMNAQNEVEKLELKWDTLEMIKN